VITLNDEPIHLVAAPQRCGSLNSSISLTSCGPPLAQCKPPP